MNRTPHVKKTTHQNAMFVVCCLPLMQILAIDDVCCLPLVQILAINLIGSA
jgi:hypothetical protein